MPSTAPVRMPSQPQDDPDQSKQATKALKCVAFTNMQVGDMLQRKYQRLERRIRSISEEIEHLKADLTDNTTHQRERRQQLSEIEDDVEKAQVLGNAVLVEELLEELRILQDEGKREEKLFQAIKKAVKSRTTIKHEFMKEKASIEAEVRAFNRKQQLIQSLLTTCAEQSSMVNNITQSSSASQSDCGVESDDDKSEKAEAVEAVEVPVTRLRRWSSACTSVMMETNHLSFKSGRVRSSSACAAYTMATITEAREASTINEGEQPTEAMILSETTAA